MEKEGVAGLKIRDRIKGAVRIRLERHAGEREAVRRALAVLSLPFNAGLALKLLYKTVDAMWYAAGDTSTDFNFYTKRATLAGVYSSTLLYWLNDRSPGSEATWAFLDRRIDDVMKIEKLKAQVRSWTERAAPGRRHEGDMAHLAAGAGLAPCRRDAAGPSGRRDSAASRSASSPIRFSMREGASTSTEPERQAADRAHQLLELAGGAGVDRPVARIVRPRRHLVGEHAAVLGDEHLQRDQPDQIEAVGQLDAEALGRRQDRRPAGPRARSWCAGCRRDGR